MSYDSEMNQSKSLSESEVDASEQENQFLTKNERKNEQKILQNDIKAMMDQFGSENVFEKISGANKNIKKPTKEPEIK